MGFNAFFFLLLISCLYLALAQVSYDDCCLKYGKKPNKATQRHIVKYRVQVVDGGCNIPALVFTAKKGHVFCADPREKWAKLLKEKLDRKVANKNNKPYKHYRQEPNRV
ncbi:C-C motif chemokine 20 [Thalassophryne amazonica]|uniref:C-C motif chemokine 20 n=1 Tax=Thalassophryne amazonica TaxID=390379 RepID=UPI001470DB09|nr:C-C motif chemokine 20 [Thalassophryne amazonica]